VTTRRSPGAPRATTKAVAADEDVRRRLSKELDRTFFVEAGAGAGKTSTLVDRVCGLVERGAPITKIAAITFTEAAAGELRERVRAELEDRADEGRPHCDAALDDVDDAPLLTLHAFAQRILAAHAIDAGLPPVVEVLDDIEATISFDRTWAAFFDSLASDPVLVPTFGAAMVLGIQERHLRALARALHDHWDLLLDAEFSPVRLRGVSLPPMVGDADRLVALAGEATAARRGCRAADDKLLIHLDDVVEPFARRLAAARSSSGAADDLAVLEVLVGAPDLHCGNGQKNNWIGPTKADVAELLSRLEEQRQQVLAGVRSVLLPVLCEEVRGLVLDRVAERRRAGRLEFHDLLVLARDLLERKPRVLAAVRASYDHLLIDEFQDTDPIQAQLAMLLGSDDRDVVPGKLFFVGDPKQSIYRFRRADIAVYSALRGRFQRDLVPLARNFRSVEPLIAWVNRVFAELLAPVDGQAPWSRLLPDRDMRADAGPAVVTFGGPTTEKTTVGALREREAADIVEVVQRVLDDPWLVADKRADAEQWRPARLDDIAILLPTRTALPTIERALDAAGIATRIESRSLIWSTQEARDLLSILRAIDDPSDQVALVAALRTPALACTDRDLLDAVAAGLRWSSPDLALLADDAPVAVALRRIDGFRDLRWTTSFTAIVETVVRDLRLLEVAMAGPRRRESWNRVRFVVDQARAFADRGIGATLRAFVDWADRQAEERARALETVVPESDHLAVRITTVHAAKGREFPIVIVAGLSVEGEPHREASVLWHDSSAPPEVRVGAWPLGWRTSGYVDAKATDEMLDQHEADRLLYVACTRARDHLVVSLHHRADGKPSHASRLHGAADAAGALHDLSELPPVLPLAPDPPRDLVPASIDVEVWRAEHEALIDRASQPASVAASALGAEPIAGFDEDPLVRAAEHADAARSAHPGAARGRAVHAVLERVDFDDPRRDLDVLVGAAAAREGLAGREEEIASLVRSVLASPAVAAARTARRRWREVYVAADPAGAGTVVEGFLDLLYEDDAGLVIVDFKTDALDPDKGAADLVARYRLQLGAYALALREALPGLVVHRSVLVVAGATRAVEVELSAAELAAAIAEVEALVRRPMTRP
jgi:ATP-dependent helicase/nuclease subunit A